MSDFSFRVCKGPTHVRPVTLPLTPEHWHFYRTGFRAGRPLTHCRDCRAVLRRTPNAGLVPAADVLPWVHELVERCGTVLAVKHTHGIPDATLYAILYRGRGKVQKRTVIRVLRALATQRKLDRANGTVNERFRQAARVRVQRDGRMTHLLTHDMRVFLQEKGPLLPDTDTGGEARVEA